MERDNIMKELKFYGSSDDLFVVNGFFVEEIENEPYAYIVQSESEGRLVVTASYMINGCWSIGISPVDEDVAIPDWYMKFCLNSNGYSTQLMMFVPDDAVCNIYKRYN